MSKLAAKPPVEEELAHKYDPGSWDADGYPTADANRQPLTDKVSRTMLSEATSTMPAKQYCYPDRFGWLACRTMNCSLHDVCCRQQSRRGRTLIRIVKNGRS